MKGGDDNGKEGYQLYEKEGQGFYQDNERDKAIIRAYLLGHYTQREIAEMTGLSQQRVAQILRVAQTKLEKDEIISNTSTSNTNIPQIERLPQGGNRNRV